MHVGAAASPGVSSYPSEFWHLDYAVTINVSSWRPPKAALHHLEIPVVIALIFTPYRASDHIGQLDPDTELRRVKKEAFNQIVIGRCELRSRMDQHFIVASESFVVLCPSVIEVVPENWTGS